MFTARLYSLPWRQIALLVNLPHAPRQGQVAMIVQRQENVDGGCVSERLSGRHSRLTLSRASAVQSIMCSTHPYRNRYLSNRKSPLLSLSTRSERSCYPFAFPRCAVAHFALICRAHNSAAVEHRFGSAAGSPGGIEATGCGVQNRSYSPRMVSASCGWKSQVIEMTTKSMRAQIGIVRSTRRCSTATDIRHGQRWQEIMWGKRHEYTITRSTLSCHGPSKCCDDEDTPKI